MITPTIAAGKGWGRFDVQSTLGVGLPTSHTETIGHAVACSSGTDALVLILMALAMLNASVGDVLYPLEAFADAERDLRRR